MNVFGPFIIHLELLMLLPLALVHVPIFQVPSLWCNTSFLGLPQCSDISLVNLKSTYSHALVIPLMCLNRPSIHSTCCCMLRQPTACIFMLLMCVLSPFLACSPHDMPYQPVVAYIRKLLYAFYVVHVHSKPFIGMHSLQHASPSCYSVS